MTASEKCPKCGSNRFIYEKRKLICANCGHGSKKANKYGAVRTEFNGRVYDSKYEASVAQELEIQKKAGEIADYETQYRVECVAYREDGTKAFTIKHRVDFRVHNKDGTFILLEAKGKETSDYKFRRKCLEELWLPFHKDHKYRVVKQGK